MSTRWVLTCEHAGNRIPAAYRSLFHAGGEAVRSHRGWDPGALALAQAVRQHLAAPLFYTTVTRLLVEPNRSVGHRRLFSEFTAGLDRRAKQALLERYYHPHRNRVEGWIDAQTGQGHRVVHLSLHTFTPQFERETRNADIGLLYDPGRAREKDLCRQWRAAINQLRPDLRVRSNYPYQGKADGFTTYLRRRFAHDRYLGIELEVNQRWVPQSTKWSQLKQHLAETVLAILTSEAVT